MTHGQERTCLRRSFCCLWKERNWCGWNSDWPGENEGESWRRCKERDKIGSVSLGRTDLDFGRWSAEDEKAVCGVFIAQQNGGVRHPS